MSAIDLRRLDGESTADYHRRLIYGKLVDKTLADYDYSEIAEAVYGQPYSSDVARRMLYGSRKTLDSIGEEITMGRAIDGTDAVIDAQIFELRKERQKFFDYRKAFTKAVRDRSRQEELNDIIIQAVQGGNLPELHHEAGPIIHSDNDLLVSLNDIHYGACVNNAWNKYNSEICKEMLGRYLNRIISIGNLHQSENCICWMNGDAISGNIHYSIAVTNKENVIEQITGVSELISQFLAELSRHFNTVYFVSVSGNHSRMIPNKEYSMPSERLDNLIEWYAKARLQNFDNIRFECNRIDNTMYAINIRGKTYVGVHGDYDGSDAKVQALQTMVGVPAYAVLSGHMHHNKVDTVQGIKTVMAGSFLGMDDYCVQKRIFGYPEQMVCVCDESGIVCHYDIDLR